MTEERRLARLRALDSCALSDALDQMGLEPAVTGIAPRTVMGRIAGRVITVKLVSGKPPADAPVRHLCTTAIETADVGGVVVVEQRTGIDAAGWGGILSNAAQVRGLSGAIIEGPARDLDEARDLGFPVFSRAATCRTARGRVYEAVTGGPIQVGDATVETGDYVLADGSGIVFVSENQVDALLDAAENIARREAHMTQQVRDGLPVSGVMGAKYEHMLSGEKA